MLYDDGEKEKQSPNETASNKIKVDLGVPAHKEFTTLLICVKYQTFNIYTYIYVGMYAMWVI